MKQSAIRKDLPARSENGDSGDLNQKKWAFFVKEESSSSGSSVPDNLSLIDGEIEIIQRNKALMEDDKISPGTALHKIKIIDRDRKLLAKCNSVITDWAIDLESSFLRGNQLLVRKVLPGSTFSHCYDNQGAFDRVVIRAHLTAKSDPLEGSHALKKLEAIRRTKHFKKLSDSSAAYSVPEIEHVNAGGDVPKMNQLLSHHSPSNPPNEAAFYAGNANLLSEEVPGLLSASGDNEPIQMGRKSKEFNECSKVKRRSGEGLAQTSKTTEQPSETHVTPPKVDLPDPKKVPSAVLEVRDFEDILANKKVIDYLNHLEDGAGVINNHLENNIEVSEEVISSLNSATSAILQEYGYDFPETTRVKKHDRRYSIEPHYETETNSESDVSDSELKSEVVKRAIEGRDFSGLLDLFQNSKEWKESVKHNLTSGSARSGKIERKIQQDHS